MLAAVDEITARPFSGVRLRGELQGRFRWRVGRYRVIYVIDDKPKLVVFLDVGHRESVYET